MRREVPRSYGFYSMIFIGVIVIIAGEIIVGLSIIAIGLIIKFIIKY